MIMNTNKVDGVIRNHRPQDGCILKFSRLENTGDIEYLTVYECLRCHRETCRCGIEFTYHWEIYQKIQDEKNRLARLIK